MKFSRYPILAGLALGACLTAAPAFAQYETHSSNGFLFNGTDEYYLYNEHDMKQVVDYERSRIVRVCAGDSPSMVPLKVLADERELVVAAGECLRVEAKKVFVEPADDMPVEAMIKVDVETLNM